MLPLPALLRKCRGRGVKLTPQRVAIFECLLESAGHPSAEEIYQNVLGRCPTLSFATVYNTLQTLVEMGEVREVVLHELRRRYDVNTGAHQHAVCRRCRRIVDVHLDRAEIVEQLERVDLSAYGFAVEAAAVEFAGLCGECSRDEGGVVEHRQ
jgi:Fur family peroxide stress response transcriptional regulator